MREQEVSLHGHKVGYLIAGDGPLIVLGHGIASNSNQNPLYAGQNPWETGCSENYQNTQPSS